MLALTPWRHTLLVLAALSALGALVGAASAAPASYRQRMPQDEVIYFVMPDRFENGDATNDHGDLKGGPLIDGFDPTRAGFYHGGDLKGVTRRLDYIQGLGATAVWLAPIFKPTRPCRARRATSRPAHHGYWITDFTDVDPHLGNKADFKALVDAAHARGMKVYMDIVVNHTADVIQYRECPTAAAPIAASPTIPTRAKAASAARRSTPASAARTSASSPGPTGPIRPMSRRGRSTPRSPTG
jgi:hypothetical protein